MRQDQLNWITFVLLAIYIADAMLALFSGVLYTIAASRCSCRLRSLVLRNMLRQDVAFFDTVRIGELLNRLSTDTEVIQSVVTSNLVGWFIPSVQVIIGFVICFWYSWQLTLVILSVTPVILIVMFLQGTCMKVLTEQELSALAGAGSKAAEVLDNIRTVRSFVTEEAEIQNYSDKINVSYFVAKKRAWISGGLGAVSSMASDACILLALWYGGQMIFAGVITTGDLISYMLFALQTVFAFQSLLSIFPQFMEAIGASVRVFELLDRVPRVNYDGGIIPPHGIEGRVTFDNVHFHYPSRPDAEVGSFLDFLPDFYRHHTVTLYCSRLFWWCWSCDHRFIGRFSMVSAVMWCRARPWPLSVPRALASPLHCPHLTLLRRGQGPRFDRWCRHQDL